MGIKYKSPEDVPMAMLTARLNELADAVTRGRDGENEFTMRVPAECDRDADIVLTESAKRLAELKQENTELKSQLEALQAYVDHVREAVTPFMSSKQIAVDGVVMVPQQAYNKWVDALSQLPHQSLNHIEARVEEETIERYRVRLPKITEDLVEQFYPWLIADDGDGYTWNQAAVDFACALQRDMPRKYAKQEKKEGE